MIIGMRFNFKNILKEIIKLFNYCTLSQIITNHKIPYTILLKHISSGDIKYIKLFGQKLINQKVIKLFKKNIFENDYIHNIKVDNINFKMKFKDNAIDQPIYERIIGKREPSTVAVLKSIVQEDFKILEIGACYGYFSIILSKLLNSKGQIISIECLPRNYEILNNNLNLNNINNVETLNYFISSQNEANVFFEKNVRDPYALIKRLKNNINLDNEIKNSSKFDGVKSISISNLLKSLNFNPNLIFMDIEGIEVDAIEDLSSNYLDEHKPIILFEIHNDYYIGDKNLNYLLSILKNKNYIIREIDGNILGYINEKN